MSSTYNVWAPRLDPNQYPVWEVHDTAKLDMSLDEVTAEVKLHCHWKDRHIVAMDLMGMWASYHGQNDDPNAYSDGATKQVPFYQPTYWPYWNVLLGQPVQFMLTDPNAVGDFTSDDGSIYVKRRPICYSTAIMPVLGSADSAEDGLDTITGIASNPAAGDDTMFYELAEITAKFSSNREKSLISEEIEWNTQALRLPPQLFSWQDATGPNGLAPPLRPEEAPGKFLRGATIKRTLFRQPLIKNDPNFPPNGEYNMIQGYLSLIGAVNGSAWKSSILGITFYPETLLFQPGTIKRTICLDGSKGWNIMLRLQWNINTWNKFYRSNNTDPQSATWEYIYADDVPDPTIYKPYPLTNDLSQFPEDNQPFFLF